MEFLDGFRENRQKKIIRLDDQIINKIAAGEIVERPAHLIKELCENSLDAGAKNIQVALSQNPQEWMEVTDDGHGIAQDELRLALERHATSKIRSLEDLLSLFSFGFRGEALASISSVTKLTLTSRTIDQSQGYRIVSQFGLIEKETPCSFQVGTKIRVEDLFGNIPARKKFLKSPAYELQVIRNQLKALAFSQPEVSWKLLIDGKLDFYLPPQSLLERASFLLQDPKEVFEHLFETEKIKIAFYYVLPTEKLKNPRNIWFFVQGRLIQDRTLMSALMEGYHGILMHKEYPQCVLSLHLPGDFVDVNVSPTKNQVRFQDPTFIHQTVSNQIALALEKLTHSVSSSYRRPITRELQPFLPISPKQFSAPLPFRDQMDSKVHFSTMIHHEKELQEKISETTPIKHAPREKQKTETPLIEQKFTDSSHPEADKKGHLESSRLTVSSIWSRLHVIGQAHLTYIVCESDSSILFIDQHAAHERVRFEKIKREISSQKMVFQELLIPKIVELPPDTKETLLEKKQSLEEWGLKIDDWSGPCIIITAHADWVDLGDAVSFLREFASSLQEEGADVNFLARQKEDWIARQACHGSIRSGKKLSHLEMTTLLQQLDTVAYSSFCPHGRPVSVEIPITALEKKSGRIV